MTKLFSTETFKIALIGSFVTIIALAICGTVIQINESKPQVESTSITK
jgi:hypothetical protein